MARRHSERRVRGSELVNEREAFAEESLVLGAGVMCGGEFRYERTVSVLNASVPNRFGT
jgi:hypothetical protein